MGVCLNSCQNFTGHLAAVEKIIISLNRMAVKVVWFPIYCLIFTHKISDNNILVTSILVLLVYFGDVLKVIGQRTLSIINKQYEKFDN